MCYVCLSVLEWNDVGSFVSISNMLFNFFIISTVNYGSLSNTILFSNPCNFYKLSLNSLTNFSTDVFFVVATKCVILDNLLQTTRIIFFLATNSNLIIKSTIRCVYSFFRTLLNFNFSICISIPYYILSYIPCYFQPPIISYYQLYYILLLSISSY